MAKKSNHRKWFVVMFAIIALASYFYGANKPTDRPSSQQYSLEKSGAAATADFTQSAKKIHDAVDSVLKQQGINPSETKEINKEVPRQGVEGKIRWHARDLAGSVSTEAARSLQQNLASQVKKAGGEVLTAQPDHYQGLPVLRIDIGLRDSLGGDAVTIVTDRIFIAEKGTAAAQPAIKTRGELALVIDDFGYTKEPIAAFAAINKPLTFAVLPYRTYSNEAAARGISSGHQVILHLPIEPLSAAEQSEQITITVDMSDSDIQATVMNAVQSLPGIIGVNNHQGSRGTADKRVMRNVLSVLKSKNLVFLDSRTNSQSVAYDTARQLGVRTGENNIFLDNDNDISAIKQQIRTAGEIAARRGTAIAIGHARMNTAAAVKEMIPELEAAGIKLVFADQLLQ